MKAERIMRLMAHPDATCKEYMKKWECSRRTYSRDKEYIELRLFMYKVEMV